MNKQDRLLEIRDFLKPYQKIWQNEIMLEYPQHLNGYPLDWMNELGAITSKEDLIRLENKDVIGLIQNPALKYFFERITELEVLPQIDPLPPMPEDRHTWLYIIPKKQHEIKRLAPVLNHLYHKHQISQVIDIGGGIGLLAQTVAKQFSLPVTSIDMNEEFQNTGNARQGNHPFKVTYKNIKVGPETEFTNLLDQSVMPVGLHTCGKLALDILKISGQNQVKALVNFGCCYHTLDLSPEFQNISNFAKSHDPVWMSKFALTLSCRAHKKMNEKDFDYKLKVKFFRYALYIFLHDNYPGQEKLSVGNSKAPLYAGPFSLYAREQFKRINLTVNENDDDLNAFFELTKTHHLIQEMLTAAFIRNALGRILEIYLLLDRAIYLEEQGYQVRVEEFFDEVISPRNIGITAERI